MRARRHLPATRPVAGDVVAAARGLGVQLGRRDVLLDVDVDVRAGQVVALVGPNGAGKSTLLAALAGDRTPDRGQVVLDGRPVGAWSAAELALRRAVLLQAHAVSFSFPVLDVVRMGRHPWSGTDPLQDEVAVADALEATRVVHLADRPVTALSGGERARVALARTLAQGAPLLLLDEPTAALDLQHQELVLQVARARAAAGDAVVVVLHDLDLAASYADRVVLLAWGRVLADGPVEEVLRADLLSEVYGLAVEVVAHPRTGRPLVLPVR